jgi:hypothetical protein
MSLIKHLSRSDEVARDKEKHTISGLVLVPAATVLKQNEAMRVMCGELKNILERCEDVIPNSGHMYLSIINSIHKNTKEALAKVDEIFSDSKEHRTSEGER